ncbi:MAG TPA: YceI family protein [Chryseolinea sp.]|nr:YceI family protein [Chryseolinea sp.]
MKTITSLLLLLVVGASYGQVTWTLDPNHTKIGFAVTHMAVSEVEGNFNQFEGAIAAKGEDFDGAAVTFSAKTASVDTDNEKRDGHLKSPDFFDAEKFPDITFKGTLAKSGTKYVLKGDFTMHGVTKPVTFDVTYGGTMNSNDKGGKKAGFKLSGEIDRKDYGLTWAKTAPGGELVVSDKVQIVCKIEADKKV